MQVREITPQLRTTDLEGTIRFYTQTLGLTLDFRYQDFYAGLRAGDRAIHLKLTDTPDPSIPAVRQHEHFHLYLGVDDVDAAAEELRRRGVELVRAPHDTPYGTRELVLTDDQGHTLYLWHRP